MGRWGEAFVFQLLLRRDPASRGFTVEWVNQAEETRAAYDLSERLISRLPFADQPPPERVPQCAACGGAPPLAGPALPACSAN